MSHAGSDEILAAALEQLARERGGTYTEGVEVSPMEIADASNSPVMWEPEVFDDTYVNHDGIRNDGTRGSTIEPHTDESRNKIWFKSLPRDPASRVIWDMVPTDYHYLKQYEPAPRKIRLPEDGSSDEATNAFLDSFINDEVAATPVIPSYIRDSIQRQYKGGKDYTIEDKKNVLDWYSRFKV